MSTTATQPQPANPVLAHQDLIVRELLAGLPGVPGVLAIYAFGSRVIGAAGPDSDLDLAVLVGGYADPLRLWDLANGLAGQVGCPVELIDFRAASTVMQHQVLTTGLRLWSSGLDADLYECFVLNEMHAFNAARAGLLLDIAKTGRIYGS